MQLTKALVILFAIALITGCASTGTYERLKASQATYCNEADPVRRAVLLAVIRSKVPGYPPSGLCTDADQLLADEIARRLAELPEGATIDIEQARADQERFGNAVSD